MTTGKALNQSPPAVDPRLAHLPPSPHKRPHTVATSLAELAAKCDVDLSTLHTAAPDGDPYMTHTQFAEHWPRFNPEQPCAGTLYVEDRDDAIWALCCDECRFEVGVPADGARTERLVVYAGLPSAFAGRPFDPTLESEGCRQALREWVRQPVEELLPAPAVHGKPGRGKSHLLVLAAEHLLHRGVQVMWVSAVQWLADLQAAIGTQAAQDRVWRRAAQADVLMLDDLGAEMATEWRADRIAALIDERYRMAGPMAVTTNVRPDDWEEAFDARTASRLRGMTFPVELQGVDWRTQGQAA